MLRVVRSILIVMLNIVFYGLAVYGCVQTARLGYGFTYEALGDTCVDLPPGEDRMFVVQTGQSEYEIAKAMETDGIIKGRYSFLVRMKLEEGSRGTLIEGNHTLNTSMSYGEILDELYGG